jgi:hypothetical protein
MAAVCKSSAVAEPQFARFCKRLRRVLWHRRSRPGWPRRAQPGRHEQAEAPVGSISHPGCQPGGLLAENRSCHRLVGFKTGVAPLVNTSGIGSTKGILPKRVINYFDSTTAEEAGRLLVIEFPPHA